MTANGDDREPVSPVSSEASAGTTAAMDESPNGGAEAVTVAATTATAAATPSAEDAAVAAAFKEAANKDFKGTRNTSSLEELNAGLEKREREKEGLGEEELELVGPSLSKTAIGRLHF